MSEVASIQYALARCREQLRIAEEAAQGAVGAARDARDQVEKAAVDDDTYELDWCLREASRAYVFAKSAGKSLLEVTTALAGLLERCQDALVAGEGAGW